MFIFFSHTALVIHYKRLYFLLLLLLLITDHEEIVDKQLNIIFGDTTLNLEK